MQPDFKTIQAVKSISQRNLVLHWQSLQMVDGLPRFTDFAPGDRAHDPKQITVWAIDEPAGARSCRLIKIGSYVTEAFGGELLLQSIPPSLMPIFKLGIDGCIDSRAIIYMLISTADADRHQIDCERLLLPFSETGREVTHVLASIQLVSVNGTIHRDMIVAQFAQEAQVTMFSCIEPSVNGPRAMSRNRASA